MILHFLHHLCIHSHTCFSNWSYLSTLPNQEKLFCLLCCMCYFPVSWGNLVGKYCYYELINLWWFARQHGEVTSILSMIYYQNFWLIQGFWKLKAITYNLSLLSMYKELNDLLLNYLTEDFLDYLDAFTLLKLDHGNQTKRKQ